MPIYIYEHAFQLKPKLQRKIAQKLDIPLTQICEREAISSPSLKAQSIKHWLVCLDELPKTHIRIFRELYEIMDVLKREVRDS